MPACPYCDIPPLVAFEWSSALYARLREQLRDDTALKSGRRLRCPVCDQAWYLDAEGATATRIPRDREALVTEWSASDLTVRPAVMSVLDAIGAIEADQYGNGRGYSHIPCAIEWSDGTVSNPCLLLVTNMPPILGAEQTVRLFQHVARVYSTDFALPLDVRRATRRADEHRMGLAPTAVKDPGGRTLFLNWSADIFDSNGIRGKDMRLADSTTRFDGISPIVSEPRDRITYVYADPPAGNTTSV